MSATEDDTELRDLLIQNLENSGVLNKLKAEMRAAVFLAMDEQDKVENKSPLVNENLRKFLHTKDGRSKSSLQTSSVGWRLVAGLILDFLHVFHLDFTLAVFQPEIHALKGLDSREQVSQELGLPDEGRRKTPLLLELLRRGRQKSEAVQDSGDARLGEKTPAAHASKIPRLRVQKQTAQGGTAAQALQEKSPTKVSLSLGKADVSQTAPSRGLSTSQEAEDQEREIQEEVDPDEGDSFFDDPLPRPQKTYGWRPESPLNRESPVGSLSDRAPGRTAGGSGGSSGDPQDPAPCRQGGTAAPVKSPRETRTSSDRHGSQLPDDDPQYDDDFNSHRSDISRSELSIGEDIEEVSIEGPNDSDKVDDDTQDLSVSQMSQSLHADYIEDVA